MTTQFSAQVSNLSNKLADLTAKQASLALDLKNTKILDSAKEIAAAIKDIEIQFFRELNPNQTKPDSYDAKLRAAFANPFGGSQPVDCGYDPQASFANVMGIEGVDYMIENGKKVPFWFNFGAPSCVPATNFETAGAVLNAEAIEKLLQRDEIKYLSEMMNYPGVLYDDEEVLKKIKSAHQLNKPVDGHAPGLMGEDALKYINAGITTDHECYTYEEGKFKAEHGMKILIREGSAAKNFEALIPLLKEFPEQIMFCSDETKLHRMLRDKDFNGLSTTLVF